MRCVHHQRSLPLFFSSIPINIMLTFTLSSHIKHAQKMWFKSIYQHLRIRPTKKKLSFRKWKREEKKSSLTLAMHMLFVCARNATRSFARSRSSFISWTQHRYTTVLFHQRQINRCVCMVRVNQLFHAMHLILIWPHTRERKKLIYRDCQYLLCA